MSSLTVTSALASASSAFALSPDSQCQIRFVCLSGARSGRRTNAPSSRALNGSMITGSGSYSTRTAAMPSAAA